MHLKPLLGPCPATAVPLTIIMGAWAYPALPPKLFVAITY